MSKGRPAKPKITMNLRAGKNGKIEVHIKGHNFSHPVGELSAEQAMLWEAMLAAVKGIDQCQES